MELFRGVARILGMEDTIADVLAHADLTPAEWKELSLGPALRWLRIRLGLRQWQAAALARVTQSRIAKIERGRDLKLSSVRKLLAAYGCGLIVLPTSAQSLDQMAARMARLFPDEMLRRRIGPRFPQRNKHSSREE